MSTARRLCSAIAVVLLSCAPTRPPAVAPPPIVPPPASTPAPPPAPEIAAESPQPAESALPWPEHCPPLAGARIVDVAHISADVGDSPQDATFILASGELAATFTAWRDAATARGARVLAEHATEHVRTASLIDDTGVRTHMLLQRSGDELAGMYQRGRRPRVALRGPCVSPPLRAREFDVERSGIGHHGEYRRERVRVHVEPRLGHDLDADGELDLLVPTSRRAECPRDITWTVYLARDGCAHAVGEVGPGELRHEDLADPPVGPRPLVFESQANTLGDGGVVARKTSTTYTFKAGRYVRTTRQTDRGVCHHCPVEQCRAP